MKKILAGLLCAAILFTACSSSGEVSSPASAPESASTTVTALEDYPWGDPGDALKTYAPIDRFADPLTYPHYDMTLEFCHDGIASGKLPITFSDNGAYFLEDFQNQESKPEPSVPPEGSPCLILSVQDGGEEYLYFSYFDDQRSSYTYQNGALYELQDTPYLLTDFIFAADRAAALPEGDAPQVEDIAGPVGEWTAGEIPTAFSSDCEIQIAIDDNWEIHCSVPVTDPENREILLHYLQNLTPAEVVDLKWMGNVFDYIFIQDDGALYSFKIFGNVWDYQQAAAWDLPNGFSASFDLIFAKELTDRLPSARPVKYASLADYLAGDVDPESSWQGTAA